MNCGPMPCKEVDTSVAVASGPRESSQNWVLAATILGSSMEFIDGTVVNVALPNLQSSLGATDAQAQWVVEAAASPSGYWSGRARGCSRASLKRLGYFCS